MIAVMYLIALCYQCRALIRLRTVSAEEIQLTNAIPVESHIYSGSESFCARSQRLQAEAHGRLFSEKHRWNVGRVPWAT